MSPEGLYTASLPRVHSSAFHYVVVKCERDLGTQHKHDKGFWNTLESASFSLALSLSQFSPKYLLCLPLYFTAFHVCIMGTAI